MNNQLIHLAFASDVEGVEGLAVAAFSVLERSSRPTQIWVIEDHIPFRAQERLRATWRRHARYSGAEFIPMSTLPIRTPTQWARKAWPLTAAARFQLAEALPSAVSRCLYLDIDVLAGIDVAALYDTDLQGNPIGMVVATNLPIKDKQYLRSINLDPEVYCNSGVALVDLDAWRSEGIAKKLIDTGRAMPANLWFFDQDMLNTYFKGRCLLLEERWNHRDAGIQPDGRIQHFAGGSKPWKMAREAARLPGHIAWHDAKERSGFQALPAPPYLKWRKTARLWAAKVQRRLNLP